MPAKRFRLYEAVSTKVDHYCPDMGRNAEGQVVGILENTLYEVEFTLPGGKVWGRATYRGRDLDRIDRTGYPGADDPGPPT